MIKYSYKTSEAKSVKAFGSGLRISVKNAVVVCRAINNMPLKKAKRLLENVLVEEASIKGRYYTNTTQSVLDLLKSAEKNAEFKGLEADRLFIKAAPQKSFTYMRPRRVKMRGEKRKLSNLQIVLEQR